MKQAGVQNFLEDFKNGSRFRHESRPKNSPEKLATLEENSQLGANRPDFSGSENLSASESQLPHKIVRLLFTKFLVQY